VWRLIYHILQGQLNLARTQGERYLKSQSLIFMLQALKRFRRALIIQQMSFIACSALVFAIFFLAYHLLVEWVEFGYVFFGPIFWFLTGTILISAALVYWVGSERNWLKWSGVLDGIEEVEELASLGANTDSSSHRVSKTEPSSLSLSERQLESLINKKVEEALSSYVSSSQASSGGKSSRLTETFNSPIAKPHTELQTYQSRL
jgi:hypothetical protein